MRVDILWPLRLGRFRWKPEELAQYDDAMPRVLYYRPRIELYVAVLGLLVTYVWSHQVPVTWCLISVAVLIASGSIRFALDMLQRNVFEEGDIALGRVVDTQVVGSNDDGGGTSHRIVIDLEVGGDTKRVLSRKILGSGNYSDQSGRSVAVFITRGGENWSVYGLYPFDVMRPQIQK